MARLPAMSWQPEQAGRLRVLRTALGEARKPSPWARPSSRARSAPRRSARCSAWTECPGSTCPGCWPKPAGRLARAEADRAVVAYRRGAADQAAELGRAALDSARAAADPGATAQALNVLGMLAARAGDTAAAEGYLRDSLGEARRRPEGAGQAFCEGADAPAGIAAGFPYWRRFSPRRCVRLRGRLRLTDRHDLTGDTFTYLFAKLKSTW